MIDVGDIMSTMGVFSKVGGNLMLFEYPHGTHDIPHVHHESPTVLSIPHGTEHILFRVFTGTIVKFM